MRKGIKYVALFLCIIVLAGCGDNQGRISNQNNVSDTINEQIATADSQNVTETEENVVETEQDAPIEPSTDMQTVEEGDIGIDYDLTQMNSDMVYATIYQLMVEPDSYVGSTIRIRGNYYAMWYEPTQKYYHYVLVQDAMACCAQGIEFVWEDGSHAYPEEYPADDAIVEVTGIFETYREPGDSYLYCRLKDASMVVQ